jgi:hypothetical protein
MARTETVQLVRDRWAALCGMDKDNIIDDDAGVFLEFLNIALNEAWQRAYWTFVTKTLAFNVDEFSFLDLSSNTEISEVLYAYDSHPWRTSNASEVKFQPVRDDEIDGIFVPGVSKADAVSVSGITRSGTTATVTTSDDHGLTKGLSVIIAGAGESDYNGTFVVQSVIDSTSFTYTVTGTPSTPATGTITSTKCVIYPYCRVRETVLTSVSDTVPFELGKFLAYKASADWLRGEGQESKALARDQMAERTILNEIDRLERQQQWTPAIKMNPRVLGRR